MFTLSDTKGNIKHSELNSSKHSPNLISPRLVRRCNFDFYCRSKMFQLFTYSQYSLRLCPVLSCPVLSSII